MGKWVLYAQPNNAHPKLTHLTPLITDDSFSGDISLSNSSNKFSFSATMSFDLASFAIVSRTLADAIFDSVLPCCKTWRIEAKESRSVFKNKSLSRSYSSILLSIDSKTIATCSRKWWLWFLHVPSMANAFETSLMVELHLWKMLAGNFFSILCLVS